MIGRVLVLIVLAAALAGCVTTGPASVNGGECRIFQRPEYAVRGKRQYDQDWIDGNIEAGVGGCGWRRPKPRPASLDAPQAAARAPATPAKRPGIIKRIKARITGRPIEPVPYVPTPVAVPVPAPKPVDPVDELLAPATPARRVY